jgi:hypothetical protein
MQKPLENQEFRGVSRLGKSSFYYTAPCFRRMRFFPAAATPVGRSTTVDDPAAHL